MVHLPRHPTIMAADLIVEIDQFVVTLEDKGVPFQEILKQLTEYIEICKELNV